MVGGHSGPGCIKDITRWRGDMNFMSSEILFLPREHKIHIFEPTCNVLNSDFIVFQSSQVLQILLGFIKKAGKKRRES